MPDEKVLGAKSREVVLAGKLPSRRPDRTWAGPGIGNSSTICGARIKQDQVEFEIQFAHDGAAPRVERFHVHLRCFAASEFERRQGGIEHS